MYSFIHSLMITHTHTHTHYTGMGGREREGDIKTQTIRFQAQESI